MNTKKETEVNLILVPRHPTKDMIEAAYWAAHNEDAETVWEKMVVAWLQTKSGNSESGNG
jgi:hypothetical protein